MDQAAIVTQAALTVARQQQGAIQVDEARLRQMLGNFLSNALKYTERGEVRMAVRVAGDLPADEEESDERPEGPPGERCALEFVVSDTGPGVPPAQIDRLFSLFTRVDAGNILRHEGTGVGLALVRRLCTLKGYQ